MVTIRRTHRPALVALVALAATIAVGTAQARPDPGERPASAQQAFAEGQRPTGPAEGTRIDGPEPQLSQLIGSAASPVASGRDLDWYSAGLGALAAVAGLGVAGGAVSLRRRGSRLHEAL